uniref:Uncharacterized protein n=1 Tax=Pipistrellus kuhlii TaxID=59472 RepID=A0A7J7YWP8_PIPKU|nr:hypothetical protein mPipKuh1_009871 [Pipistrellus kuhlii]
MPSVSMVVCAGSLSRGLLPPTWSVHAMNTHTDSPLILVLLEDRDSLVIWCHESQGDELWHSVLLDSECAYFGSMTHIMAWVRLAVMFEDFFFFFFFFYKTFLTKLVKGRFDGQECRLCRECQNLFVILSFVTTKPKIMLS